MLSRFSLLLSLLFASFFVYAGMGEDAATALAGAQTEGITAGTAVVGLVAALAVVGVVIGLIKKA